MKKCDVIVFHAVSDRLLCDYIITINDNSCFATYAAGKGVAFLNNRCEGAHGVIDFNGG
jgi:hypothetical protein